MSRLARRAGEDQEILLNGLIIVAFAALIGGRAYHVIDQWDSLYKDHIERIFLPPYSGLGVYGGIITGTIAAWLYARWKHVPFLRWADIVAPGLFDDAGHRTLGELLQPGALRLADHPAVGHPDRLRPPHRGLPVRAGVPVETTRFHPLFLYESLSGLVGAARARLDRLPPAASGCASATCSSCSSSGTGRRGSSSRPCATTTGPSSGSRPRRWSRSAIIVPAIVILAWRHRRGHPLDDPPTHPDVATWGALGRPVERGGLGRATTARAAGPADDDWAPDVPRAPTRMPRRAWGPPQPPTSRRRRPRRRVRPGAGPPAGLRWPNPGRRPRARRGDRRRRACPPRRWPPRGAAPSKASPGSAARPRPTPRSCTASCGWSPGSSSSWSSGSGSGRPARGDLPRGGYLLVAAAHRGWMDPFVVMHAIPPTPRAWFLGSAPSTFTSALARAADPPGRRPAAGVARRRRRGRARRGGARGRRQRGGLRPDARRHGQRTARADRGVPQRLGDHRAPDGRADRAARDGRDRGALSRPAAGVAGPAGHDGPCPRRAARRARRCPSRAHARSSTPRAG